MPEIKKPPVPQHGSNNTSYGFKSTSSQNSSVIGFSPIEKLSYREFHPYTDLLLHDMGPVLDDGYTEGFANTNEWRTPPLWGLGLAKDSQGGKMYLMHDGRARSIEEAILLHGGEAERSKNEYEELPQPQKDQLLRFLNSL